MTNQPYVKKISFDGVAVSVSMEIVGHPTGSLELAREIAHRILSGHGAWCFNFIHGYMPENAMYPSEMILAVTAQRME